MNILLDPFTNRIYIFKPGTSRTLAFRADEPASSPLDSVDSCIHALEDIEESDCMNILKSQSGNTLILPDFLIGFGTFVLPSLSKLKMGDAFQTRFKLCYPKYKEYYMTSEEYRRSDSSVTYFYTFAVRKNIEMIVSYFKSRKVVITDVDYYANVVGSNLEKDKKYPAYYLFVGDDYSEFMVWGGTHPIGTVSIPFGRQTITNPEKYLESGYFYKNDRAKKYSAFLAESYTTEKELNDETIDEMELPEAEHKKPRALRMLKGQALEAYLFKNNAKKLLSMVNDLVLYYHNEPWYVPVSTVKVVCNEDFYQALLEKSADFTAFEMERVDREFDEMRQLHVADNPLFKKSVKAERRKIDWKKFLNMSIGPKKKA